MLDYLVITAHPDDESAAAGLLLTAKSHGLKTGMITLTQGEAGGFADAVERTAELHKAVSLLSLDYFRHLDLPDANVEFNSVTVARIIPLLREVAPRVVLTIHPDDYHPDHLAVSRIVDKAVFTAGLKKYANDDKTWHPSQVLYFSLDPRTNSSRPDIIFDISPVIEKKRAILRSYASQQIEQFMESNARYLGMLGGFDFAEGFYIRQPLRLTDPKIFLNHNKIGR